MKFLLTKHQHFIFAVLVVIISATLIFKYQTNSKTTSALSDNQYQNPELLSGQFNPSMTKSLAEWKQMLTPEQFHILREAGTEYPFSGDLNHETRVGTYYSVGCNVPLFRSEQKYDSKTGWPSFWAPIDNNNLVLRKESAPGDNRIEVLDVCGGHLGHVFDDGPKPTGKRYCMNSVALKFIPD